MASDSNLWRICDMMVSARCTLQAAETDAADLLAGDVLLEDLDLRAVAVLRLLERALIIYSLAGSLSGPR